MAVVYRCAGILTVNVVFFRSPGVFHSQDSFPSTFRPRLWETSSGEVAVDVFAAVARSNTTTVCCKMIKPPLFSRLYRNNSLNDCVANCLKPYCGYVYPRILWPLPHCLMRTNITTRSVAWCILIQLPVAKWCNQLIRVYKHTQYNPSLDGCRWLSQRAYIPSIIQVILEYCTVSLRV